MILLIPFNKLKTLHTKEDNIYRILLLDSGHDFYTSSLSIPMLDYNDPSFYQHSPRKLLSSNKI